MKRTRFVAAVVALSAIVSVPFAYSAGLWYGLPVLGGSSYCSGNVGTGTSATTGIGTSGTTTVCAVTVPAGPTTLTGTEMLPADLLGGSTAGSGGPGSGPVQSGTQTAYMPVATAASGAYFLTTNNGLSAAITASVPNGITNVILNATGTVTVYALQLPSNPYDGQLVRFTSNATLTTIIVETGSLGQTVDTPTKPFSPLVPNVSTGLSVTSVTVIGFEYLFNLSNNRWFRLQ